MRVFIRVNAIRAVPIMDHRSQGSTGIVLQFAISIIYGCEILPVLFTYGFFVVIFEPRAMPVVR